jgi:WD40 repeat protein
MPSEPRDLDYSPDGQRLAVLCSGGQLLLIHPLEGRILSQWQATGPIRLAFYVTAGRIRFSPDGQSLVTYGTESSVPVWDTTTGKARYPALRHQGTCLDAQFSADGRLLVTAGYEKTARVWDYATGRSEGEPLVHPAEVLAVAFSRDGQHVLTACADKMARLWDWRTHQLVCPPFVHEQAIFAAAFHPNRRWILTGSRDKTMRIWEWQTGKPVTPPLATGGFVLNLGVTPDGQYAVVGGYMDALKVFDLGYLSAPNELDGDDLCAWGELVSGQRIQEGGGVTNLTAEEWLQRWRAFRQRHPEYPKMEPTAATMRAGAEPLLLGSGLSGR